MSRGPLCPVLVRREDQLAALEDALLSAHRSEGRFVLLAGEAGIGKTRLAIELAGSARRLGSAVLWGGCSEAELALPYLPFVEAIGNHLNEEGVGAVAGRLGPERRELAQLFPQLAGENGAPREGDPEQAKLRLFEAIVSLLEAPAAERGLVLVIEDVHWADESSRELLDHLARRLKRRAMILATYRSDELHRRHPLLPLVRGWQRSGVAEMVELEPLPDEGVEEMIAAILGTAQVDSGLRALMSERSGGNPFVLEELLKDASEGGTPTGGPAQEPPALPDSVRESILLRLSRLDPEHATILEAGAVLGRSFDHRSLLAVSGEANADVSAALESAIAQQLIEEVPEHPGRYRWRHALTQEAIYGETIAPRRQEMHSRAADALADTDSAPPIDLARHLLGAGRIAEAVPVCLKSAEEAERTAAFHEAISLLERALPHLPDEVERARVICRIGEDHWLNGEAGVGAQFLVDGIATLEEAGLEVEAARSRLILGRCWWEDAKPEPALEEFERAKSVLEEAGPSAELAVAHMRIAGLRAFDLDYQGCRRAAEAAMEIAKQAGAEYERVWALAFLALGLIDAGTPAAGLKLMDECFAEAQKRGYWHVAYNVTYNDVWTRTHMGWGDLESRLERYSALPANPLTTGALGYFQSLVWGARGQLREALAAAERAQGTYGEVALQKFVWRSNVQMALVLTELGRTDEAERVLPPPEARTELQDVVYDSAAQIRTRLAAGDIEGAAQRADEIVAGADGMSAYGETLALGTEALIAAGRTDDAHGLVGRVNSDAGDAALAWPSEIEGRVLLADGRAPEAIGPLAWAVQSAQRIGYPLVELRARIKLAEARAAAGEGGPAERELHDVAAEADRLGAALIRREAGAAAAELGIELPTPQPDAGRDEVGDAGEPIAFGERMVTVLFADVRGYTELTSAMSPDEMAERLATLYRFAKTAVERQGGIVDKFAGDAVMATFNVSGDRLDHTVRALEAALNMRDKSALMNLPLGIGIAVGPAVLGRGASDGNLAVTGEATNLAARLQAAAQAGEIVLSGDSHRRVERRLSEAGLSASAEDLELKGINGLTAVHRIPPALGTPSTASPAAGAR
jgi:class 3 adenylate cyclase/tetratricopeptide (TPR) repeat protein